MKKIVCSLLAMLAMSTTINAQKLAEWSSFYVQYNPITMVQDFSNSDDLNFNGFTIGFDKALSITDDTPLFIQVGGAVQAAFYSDSNDDEDYSVNFYAIKVPVSLTYKWNISDAVALQPYAGINARFNLSGKEKTEYEYGDDDERNLFKKKDMGSSDATWKRMLMGWQIGANVMFNDTWHLGISYGSDFTSVCKKTKFNTTSITLGFDF